jgi:hypothetical protein
MMVRVVAAAVVTPLTPQQLQQLLQEEGAEGRPRVHHHYSSSFACSVFGTQPEVCLAAAT